MIDLTPYKAIDEILFNIGEIVRPLYYTEPTNAKELKDPFLQDSIENPDFTYKPLEYNPEDVEMQLDALAVPQGPLHDTYLRWIEETRSFNNLIRDRDRPNATRYHTIHIHGAPGEDLVKIAQEALTLPKTSTKQEKDIPAENFKATLEERLHAIGFTDWDVVLSDKRLTTVNPREKRVRICNSRSFSYKEVQKSVIEDLGVHILRAENGHQQPLKIFAVGLPGYLSTEQGLVSYFVGLSRPDDNSAIRHNAAKVLAVKSIVDGKTFRQTFDIIRSYGLNEAQSYDLAVRAHKGGGYIKDHLNLKGLSEVRKYVESGGGLGLLFVGKVGIADLPLVTTLFDDGAIKGPKYLPDFIRKD